MNQITVNFDACTPAPSGGYQVLWREKGTTGAYLNAGSFGSSPAVFSDDGAYPNGTEFEGVVRSDCGTSFGTSIYWTTNEDCTSCNTLISQQTNNPSYLDLGLFPLHVECATSVQLLWQVYDRPNRFTLYDNGTFVSSTGWVGTALYPGPWGTSNLIQTAISGVIPFDVVLGHVYTLRVEISPTGPPDYLSDNFDVFVACT